MNEREIFLAALEIDCPTDRAAYVARACADNPSLRQRLDAIRALLIADGIDRAAGLLVDDPYRGAGDCTTRRVANRARYHACLYLRERGCRHQHRQ